ncbi:MAG TPA: tRNA (adenosine(37)-N6)-dimethylallyltransferase MiaA [Actinomycetota bacterium]|nr:tRNA (adenosine(37)-N6)-dimethylallyltransferase MiaA [Actinomycetota bacterium]
MTGSSGPRVLAIVGPTATGKTKLAVEVAERIRGEIVSVDSAQIYRGMDVGTAKPSPADLGRVPHHMIDVADPSETISVSAFREKARAAVMEIVNRGRIPLIVGGSGLYFRAVVDPLEFPGTDSVVRARVAEEAEEVSADQLHNRLAEKDPAAAARIDHRNTRRVIRALEVIELTGRKFSDFRTAWDSYDSIYDLKIAGLTFPLEDLDRRINERVDQQMQSGLLQEVEELKAREIGKSVTSVQALGYAQLLSYLEGHGSIEDAALEIKARTRRFARRQLTWFRADPRVHWFEANLPAAADFLQREASK